MGTFSKKGILGDACMPDQPPCDIIFMNSGAALIEIWLGWRILIGGVGTRSVMEVTVERVRAPGQQGTRNRVNLLMLLINFHHVVSQASRTVILNI
mmetsp:Transcript_3813/g.7282  ORF Transcript_3813/g.7282 Transcript_3813/m.7282 type:complete len:96 (-) Transcript_3813:63-350(-)